MAKTVIVSDETARQLIEAYASLAAWFYQLSEAARRAGAGVAPPSDAQRRAYAEQAGALFPELAAIAAGVTAPRPFIPPPALTPAPATPISTPAAVPPAPTSAAVPAAPISVPSSATGAAPAAPPPVDPSKVRY